jgi:ketosteroid isomerase-like protein
VCGELRARCHAQSDGRVGRSEVVEILDLVTTADGKIKTVEEFTDTTSILRLTAA